VATNISIKHDCQCTTIIDVIAQHIELRQHGREFWGLCPFHAEKTPSFAVNPDKGVFYCHGCHAGGDAITFIEKIEGIDFKTAARRLGLETYRPSPAQLRIKHEAKRITLWARATSTKLCNALREIGEDIRVCKLARQQQGMDQAAIARHEASLIRQWAILSDLDDDLSNSKLAVELWQQHEEIDRFLESLA